MIEPEGPYWLDPQGDPRVFPDPARALVEPNGLLAVGGDLSAERLLNAYSLGIFPWYSDGQPIMWWSPNPRSVLFPKRLKISRSLRKTLRKGLFEVKLDTAFASVIEACSAPRSQDEGDESGTWITEEMKSAYIHLHELGFAHSAESWADGELVGGLYGVAIGGVFFGESMFTRRSDASKVAFVHLVRQLEQWGFGLIDCQMSTAHLNSLGAVDIPREAFMELLERNCRSGIKAPGYWRLNEAITDVWNTGGR